jgi:hypothetical protein
MTVCADIIINNAAIALRYLNSAALDKDRVPPYNQQTFQKQGLPVVRRRGGYDEKAIDGKYLSHAAALTACMPLVGETAFS